MSRAQQRWILVAAAVAESAWLFAAFGIVGILLMAGLGGGVGSPMTWPSALTVLAVSAMIRRAGQLVAMPPSVSNAFQTAAGLTVLYLVVANQVDPATRGFDVVWARHVMSVADPVGSEFTFRAVVGSLMALVLWWRGLVLASSGDPVGTIVDTFKRGVVTIACAAIVDSLSSVNLYLYPTMFIFVVSGFAGLSVGHLLPASSGDAGRGTWPVLIGASMVPVLAIGSAFGQVPGSWLAFIGRMVLEIWLFIFDNVLLPIIALIARPVGVLFEWLMGLWQPDPQGDIRELDESMIQLREAAEGWQVSQATEVTIWIVVIILLAAAVFALSLIVGRRRTPQLELDVDRESIRVEANPLYDVARLLFGLLPESWRRGKHHPFSLPEGEPLVVEALRIYYEFLALAESRRIARPAWETPVEFQAKLEATFPPRLVRLATAAFIRACYGYHPPTEEDLSEIRLHLGPYA